MDDFHLDSISSKSKRNQDVKKSIENYAEQVKIHFDLTEGELVKILEKIVFLRKNNNHSKKWWQLWK